MSGLRGDSGTRRVDPFEDPFPVSLEKAEKGWRVVAHPAKKEGRRR